MAESKKILISALDWGLGHASRCIPIISFLEKEGHQIVLASSKKAGILWQKEFPHLPYYELPSYQIMYAKHRRTDWKIAWQAPKILQKIKAEHQQLLDLASKEKFDVIISDNRFGMYHPSIPSVFISHQLQLQLGFFELFAPFINRLQSKFIHRFSECWVPDFEGENNLSGKLSNPAAIRIPVKFIGPLSRTFIPSERVFFEFPIGFILSGPEPQRTIFEEKIVAELHASAVKAIIVRGTNETSNINYPENCKVVHFANHQELENILQKVDVVVSRSGYSSVMDAFLWQKKWAFCPTPNQPEQEYLAQRMAQKWGIYVFSAHQFSVKDILINAKKLEIEKQNSTFEDTISHFLNTLNTNT